MILHETAPHTHIALLDAAAATVNILQRNRLACAQSYIHIHTFFALVNLFSQEIILHSNKLHRFTSVYYIKCVCTYIYVILFLNIILNMISRIWYMFSECKWTAHNYPKWKFIFIWSNKEEFIENLQNENYGAIGRRKIEKSKLNYSGSVSSAKCFHVLWILGSIQDSNSKLKLIVTWAQLLFSGVFLTE